MKAVELIVGTQNEEGGWRYNPVPYDADVSVTICQVMALRSARNSGIKVPKQTIDRAVEYVRKCQNPDGGFKYMLQAGGSAWPRSAAGVSTLYYAGIYEDDSINRGLDYLMRNSFPGTGMAVTIIANRATAGRASVLAMQYYMSVTAMIFLLFVTLAGHLSGAEGFEVTTPHWSVLARCAFIGLTATLAQYLIFMGTSVATGRAAPFLNFFSMARVGPMPKRRNSLGSSVSGLCALSAKKMKSSVLRKGVAGD